MVGPPSGPTARLGPKALTAPWRPKPERLRHSRRKRDIRRESGHETPSTVTHPSFPARPSRSVQPQGRSALTPSLRGALTVRGPMARNRDSTYPTTRSASRLSPSCGPARPQKALWAKPERHRRGGRSDLAESPARRDTCAQTPLPPRTY